MKRVEYFLSVFLAMLVLGGAAAWTQVSRHGGETALSCRPGQAAAPVVLKGMSVYPRCLAKNAGRLQLPVVSSKAAVVESGLRPLFELGTDNWKLTAIPSLL